MNEKTKVRTNQKKKKREKNAWNFLWKKKTNACRSLLFPCCFFEVQKTIHGLCSKRMVERIVGVQKKTAKKTTFAGTRWRGETVIQKQKKGKEKKQRKTAKEEIGFEVTTHTAFLLFLFRFFGSRCWKHTHTFSNMVTILESLFFVAFFFLSSYFRPFVDSKKNLFHVSYKNTLIPPSPALFLYFFVLQGFCFGSCGCDFSTFCWERNAAKETQQNEPWSRSKKNEKSWKETKNARNQTAAFLLKKKWHRNTFFLGPEIDATILEQIGKDQEIQKNLVNQSNTTTTKKKNDRFLVVEGAILVHFFLLFNTEIPQKKF